MKIVVIEDPTMPASEISFRQGDIEVGRIVNIAVPDPAPEACVGCGKTLHVGEWPFCPHGMPERAGGAAMIDDQIAGGPRYFENLGPEKVWVESKSQLRDEMRARGLRSHVQHVGVPGSDRSPHTRRWI